MDVLQVALEAVLISKSFDATINGADEGLLVFVNDALVGVQVRSGGEFFLAKVTRVHFTH